MRLSRSGSRKQPSKPQNRIDSLIGVGTKIEGNVNFTGGLRVDGEVVGYAGMRRRGSTSRTGENMLTAVRRPWRKRGIATSDMAARLFVSRDTLWRLERGDPTVSLGTLATAAFILKLHDRIANLAAPGTDELALSLDERRLPQRIRRSRP